MSLEMDTMYNGASQVTQMVKNLPYIVHGVCVLVA